VNEPVRVASIQYFIRPVSLVRRVRDQVSALVDTAADYKATWSSFPEYFTVQLLTLGDGGKPIREAVRDLADQGRRYLELMSGLAREYGLYIVAGTIPAAATTGELHNDCHVFGPDGGHGRQGKLHMTRWEKEEWNVSPRRGLRLFETDFGKLAVNICYDVEFPEIARAAARRAATSSSCRAAPTTARASCACATAPRRGRSRTRCTSSRRAPSARCRWCRRCRSTTARRRS
jgi:predicted amidohydrolase